MATANFLVNAEDGWVKIAEDVAFLRVSAVPRKHSFLITDTASGAPAPVATRATGTITFSGGVPTADDTVTIGGQVFVFKASAASALQVTIGADEAATATNLAAKINSNSTVVTATKSGGVVTVTANAPGTGGNAIVLTTDADNTAVSGSGTLTNAVNAAPYVLVNECDGPFFVDVPIAGEIYVKVIDSQPDYPVRIDVFTVPGS